MKKIWHFFSTIGVHNKLIADEKRRGILVNRMIFLASLFTFFFVPAMFVINMTGYVIPQTLVGLFCSATFLFTRQSKFSMAAFMLMLILGINLICCNALYPGTGVEYFFFPMTAIPFVAFKKLRSVYLGIVWCILCYFTAHFLIGIVPPAMIILEPYLTFINSLVMIVALSTLLLFLGILRFANENFEKMLVSERQEIAKQKEVIEEKQKEILDSIHYAKRIQTALLTNEKYIERVLRERKR